MVQLAKEAFDRIMPAPNQIASKKREDVNVTAADLLHFEPEAPITEKGLRLNINVAIQYIGAWGRHQRAKRAGQGGDLHVYDTRGGGMRRILIVEDNEKNLKLVRDILQAKGFETMEAITAEDGLALVKLHHFDLVLMDIQLPGMNGIEALARLRADEMTRDIPVVAVTASVTIQDQSQITRAGFDAFISKPISVKEFLETVNAFVGKSA